VRGTIRNAKDTGLRNLPLHGYEQNRISCEIVALAGELLAWMQMLAFDGPARRWEPKRLRLRIFAVAGRIVRGGRRLRLRLAARWPWNAQITAAATRLPALAPRADQPKPSLRTGGNQQGPWNPAHPARQPGHQARPEPKTKHRPTPQAAEPRSRKIEAKARTCSGLSSTDGWNGLRSGTVGSSLPGWHGPKVILAGLLSRSCRGERLLRPS
jgi:Transposase DDE domain group 1